MSLAGRFVGARDLDSALDSVFSGLFLASSYALILSLACLAVTPAMVDLFLEPGSSVATRDLPIWGTQLNAFLMFILAWSSILGGALRGAGDTYGVMFISAGFWWLQYALVVILIQMFGLHPDDVLTIHVLSSPVLLIAIMIRFRSGVWRKLKLIDWRWSLRVV